MESFPWAGVTLALFLATLMVWAEIVVRHPGTARRHRRPAGEVESVDSTGAGHRENPGAGPLKITHKGDRT